MSPYPDDHSRYGTLGASSGMRAWGAAHPVAMAAWQGLAFGILMGIIWALSSTHRSLGTVVAGAAIVGVLFGLAMWTVSALRRRRQPGRG